MRVKGWKGKKTTTEARRGKKEERRKRVKSLCSYFSTGSCACVFVFGAVVFEPSLFYEPFFVRQHIFIILHSWEFRCGCFFYLPIIVHCLCFDRGRIHAVNIQTFKNYWFAFAFFFYFLSFDSNVRKAKGTVCVCRWNNSWSIYILNSAVRKWCHNTHNP